MADKKKDFYKVEEILYYLQNGINTVSDDWNEMLYEAYIREINSKNCARLEALINGEEKSLCPEEERALKMVYRYYQSMEGPYMNNSVSKVVKKIIDIFEQPKNNGNGTETEKTKEFEETVNATEESVEKEDVSDEPQVPDFTHNNEAASELKSEKRILEDKIKQLQNEIEEKNTELIAVKAQAEHTKVRYKEKKENLAKEEIRLKKEWQEKYESDYNAAMAQAKEKIAAYESELRIKADEKAEDTYKELLKDKVGEYVGGVRDEWRHTHEDMAETNEEIARNISNAKVEACTESSRIQREMRSAIEQYKAQLDESMLSVFAGLDRWRESIFDIQLNDFAEWYSRFGGFVDRFDSRLINSLEDSGNVARIGSSLNSLKNALERILPSMGLRSYYPTSGEKYDPVYHEAVEEDFIGGDAIIKSCITPGVELISSNDELRRVLVKAEVDIEVN